MGALPKRKRTRARQGFRWGHLHTTAPNVAVCPHCGKAKLPHRVCPNCGRYRGREVIPAVQEEGGAS